MPHARRKDVERTPEGNLRNLSDAMIPAAAGPTRNDRLCFPCKLARIPDQLLIYLRKRSVSAKIVNRQGPRTHVAKVLPVRLKSLDVRKPHRCFLLGWYAYIRNVLDVCKSLSEFGSHLCRPVPNSKDTVGDLRSKIPLNLSGSEGRRHRSRRLSLLALLWCKTSKDVTEDLE